MTERLPLFPLGTVLFPGQVLPLHVFEERYRRLVRDLLDGPEPRRFGVVSARPGPERFASVGCAALLHAVSPRDDGRFDIVAIGTRRFRVESVDESNPYLCAQVEFLPDGPGGDPDPAARRVARLYRLYRERLSAAGAETVELIEPPGDPVRLSHLIAGAMVLGHDDKQRLLEAPDATDRLIAEQGLLNRENRLLEALPAVPAVLFADGGAPHPN